MQAAASMYPFQSKIPLDECIFITVSMYTHYGPLTLFIFKIPLERIAEYTFKLCRIEYILYTVRCV